MKASACRTHLAVAAVSLGVLCGSCAPPVGTEGAESGGAMRRVLHQDSALPEFESWVDFYDPGASSGGYNLLLTQDLPVLIDMNGRVVHAWPALRVAGRARLLANGAILVISRSGGVGEYSWEGEQVWGFRLPGEDFTHHDLIRLASGSRLVLGHDTEKKLDYLVEVTPAGEIAWRWDAAEHLAGELARASFKRNRTHINSLYELGENRWWAAGDERFRPGNILISARNLNAIYLIDKASGRVVWRYYGKLDHQHEAQMIPHGRPGTGNILVFNNGLLNLYAYRRSSILEIDPSSGAVAWSYESPYFFSSTGGTQQSLSNGNLLVTSTMGRRAFEITREGRIVWQLSPPKSPGRMSRYPYDHCPQLAAMGRPEERRVDRRDPRRYVDKDLYTFALRHERRRIKQSTPCRRLLLPERAGIEIRYGVKPPEAQPDLSLDLDLKVRLAIRGDEPGRVLMARREGFAIGGGSASSASRLVRLSLEGLALRSVELCLEATAADGQPAPPTFFWRPPKILSGPEWSAGETRRKGRPLTAMQEEHLRAMGYLD